MLKRYIVRLSDTEHGQLEQAASTGKAAACKIKRANILLKVDAEGPGWADAEAAEAFSCHRNMVANVCARFVGQGLEAAVERKKRATPGRTPVCDGKAAAKLIALRCGQPPAGQAKRTLRLLADKAVELEIGVNVARVAVRRTARGACLLLSPHGPVDVALHFTLFH